MGATHRVIHIGDLHLGPNARQADRLAALDLIADTTIPQPDIALFVLAGDLFDKTSRIDDRNLLVPRAQRLANRAPVLITKGNHDEEGDLDFIAQLKAKYPITVSTRPEVLKLPLATGETAAIATIPYPSRAGLVGAGVESGTLEQTGSQAFEVMVIGLAAQMNDAAADATADGIAQYIPVVFGHINIAGARASTGQPQIGREIELSAAALERFPQEAYLGFNHIHKHQTVGRAVYAGSLCRLDFGEVEPKGYIEVTYLKVGNQWRHTWQFVELPVAPLYHVEGNLTRDDFTFVCTTGYGGDVIDTPASWKGIEARVRYTFNKAESGVLDVARIHAVFAEAKSLKLDPVPLLEQKVRAPEIAAAITLEDKLKACCELQAIRWTPGLATKLAALQTQDPAVILAGVTGQPAPSSSAPDAATRSHSELLEVHS